MSQSSSRGLGRFARRPAAPAHPSPAGAHGRQGTPLGSVVAGRRHRGHVQHAVTDVTVEHQPAGELGAVARAVAQQLGGVAVTTSRVAGPSRSSSFWPAGGSNTTSSCDLARGDLGRGRGRCGARPRRRRVPRRAGAAGSAGAPPTRRPPGRRRRRPRRSARPGRWPAWTLRRSPGRSGGSRRCRCRRPRPSRRAAWSRRAGAAAGPAPPGRRRGRSRRARCRRRCAPRRRRRSAATTSRRRRARAASAAVARPDGWANHALSPGRRAALRWWCRPPPLSRRRVDAQELMRAGHGDRPRGRSARRRPTARTATTATSDPKRQLALTPLRGRRRRPS